jgi:intraflagellar transport protein 172
MLCCAHIYTTTTLHSHHEEAGQLSQAERFYCDADAPELAVEMYTRVNQWDAAHKLATSYMSEGEVRMLYIDQVRLTSTITC